jgi:putative flippase GtrA
MQLRLSKARILEVVRYYQAGVVNTVFGITAYLVLVWFGLNMFVAQLAAHVMGVSFNYFMYRNHVFRETAPAKLRFIASYVGNYLLSLATLALLSRFIASPYVAGLATVLLVSVVNYFALKHLVFHEKAS